MKIIITMSGEGSRFKNIGFTIPKHEIIAKDKTLFEWSMLSLKDFFDEEFIFIVRKDNYDEIFIKEKVKRLGIRNYSIIEINYLTEGQASTALLADEIIRDDDSILIYNIDTYIEENSFTKKDICKEMDGLVPSFKAKGEKWSFVDFDKNYKISEITEKVKISNYGTVGIYYFKRWEDYKNTYNQYKDDIKEKYNEVYIAPMYQYMIDKGQKVYASLIENKNLHVLGTPEDIEYFDYDYLEKQKDGIPYINHLISLMDFTKLNNYYINVLKNTDKYILEYILFLADIGDVKKLEEIFKNYELEQIIHSPYYVCINNSRRNAIETLYSNYKTFNTIFKGENSRIYLESNQNIHEIYNLIKNKKINILENPPFISTAILINYLVNNFIEKNILQLDVLERIINSITNHKIYSKLRIKYILFRLFPYLERFYPTFFIQTGNYTSMFKFHALLARDMGIYYPGIKKYSYKMYKLSNIELTEKYNNKNLKQIQCKSSGKVAITISGALRLNYLENLMKIKKRIADNVDADIFISCWENHYVYPGFGRYTGEDEEWSQLLFRSIEGNIPKEIRTNKMFKNILPNTYKVFSNPIINKVSISDIKQIFPEATIKVENETSFEEKYKGNKGFIRRGSLNQAKMFYGIHQSHKLIEESPNLYDYIVRVRPDIIPRNNLNIDELHSLGGNEVCGSRGSFGIQDIYYYGEKNVMLKISKVWELATFSNDLSPFLNAGKRYDYDSHMVYNSWCAYNGIIVNTTNKSGLEQRNAYMLPFFEEELKKDLEKLPFKEQKKYSDFFTEYFKKYQIKESKNNIF